MSSACAGLLRALQGGAAAEVAACFARLYAALRESCVHGMQRDAFNAISARLKSSEGSVSRYLVHVLCLTSLSPTGNDKVKILLDGCLDRLVAYVFNYAAIHLLSSLSAVRARVDSFRAMAAELLFGPADEVPCRRRFNSSAASAGYEDSVHDLSAEPGEGLEGGGDTTDHLTLLAEMLASGGNRMAAGEGAPPPHIEGVTNATEGAGGAAGGAADAGGEGATQPQTHEVPALTAGGEAFEAYGDAAYSVQDPRAVAAGRQGAFERDAVYVRARADAFRAPSPRADSPGGRVGGGAVPASAAASSQSIAVSPMKACRALPGSHRQSDCIPAAGPESSSSSSSTPAGEASDSSRRSPSPRAARPPSPWRAAAAPPSSGRTCAKTANSSRAKVRAARREAEEARIARLVRPKRTKEKPTKVCPHPRPVFDGDGDGDGGLEGPRGVIEELKKRIEELQNMKKTSKKERKRRTDAKEKLLTSPTPALSPDQTPALAFSGDGSPAARRHWFGRSLWHSSVVVTHESPGPGPGPGGEASGTGPRPGSAPGGPGPSSPKSWIEAEAEVGAGATVHWRDGECDNPPPNAPAHPNAHTLAERTGALLSLLRQAPSNKFYSSFDVRGMHRAFLRCVKALQAKLQEAQALCAEAARLRSGVNLTYSADCQARAQVRCGAVLCCAVLCCVVLCCAVLCCVVLCCAVLSLLPAVNCLLVCLSACLIVNLPACLREVLLLLLYFFLTLVLPVYCMQSETFDEAFFGADAKAER
jgi:hypothetical protein